MVPDAQVGAWGSVGTPCRNPLTPWDSLPLTLGSGLLLAASQRQGQGPGHSQQAPAPHAVVRPKPAISIAPALSVPQVCRTGCVHPFLHVRHPPLLPGSEVHPWLGQFLHPWVRLGELEGGAPTGKILGWATKSWRDSVAGGEGKGLG